MFQNIGVDYPMMYFWLIVAIIFLFAEIGTPGLFFFLSFVLGAICAAVLVFLEYSIVVQCLGGLGVAMVTFVFLRILLKRKKLSEVLYDSADTNIDALSGRRGIVVEKISVDRKGCVKIGGELWRAKLDRVDEGGVLQEGTFVSVLRVEGNTVVVKSMGEKL